MLYSIWRFADYMAGYEQQDAHEFLVALLNALQSHLQQPQPQPGPRRGEQQSFVHQVFSGMFRSDLSCLRCGATSSTYEPFLDLSLPLEAKRAATPMATGRTKPPQRLEECLEQFMSSEVLTDSVTCEACGQTAQRSKQITIDRLPNVLTLHVKRFDAVNDRKISDPIEFPGTSLDMAPYLSSCRVRQSSGPHAAQGDAMGSAPARPKILYDLTAVVNHSGSMSQGHYTAFVVEGGQWFRCDDTQVSPATEQEVLQSEGYMLFFIRRRFSHVGAQQPS